MSNDLVRRLEDLYVSYRGRFVVSRPAGMYIPKAKLSTKYLLSHIHQNCAICVFAGERTSKFLCFDVDIGGRDSVRKIVAALAELGFDRSLVYISTSGGKGYHVEMFFDGLVETSLLRRVYDEVLRLTGLDIHAAEFRPTHTQAIKLPLSVHRKTGNVCWFCDQATLEPIEDYSYIFSIRQMDHNVVERIASSISHRPAAHGTRSTATNGLPPIRSHDYPDITARGQRHELMVRIAIFCRQRGMDETLCRRELADWYERQRKDLIESPRADVFADIGKIVGWAYSTECRAVSHSIVFTQVDISLLLAMGTRAKRRIMFLIMRGSKKYGYAQASQDTMAKELGISVQTIVKALGEMDADGVIVREAEPTRRTTSGLYVAKPHRYRPSDVSKTVDGLRLDCVGLPRDGTSLMADYYGVLHAFCDMDMLRRFLKPKEIKEYEEAIANGTYTTAAGAAQGDTARRELCA